MPIFGGKFYIIEPSDEGGKILHTLEMDGNLIGSPSIWNGHLYLHTTKALHCWKFKQEGITAPKWPAPYKGKAGDAVEVRAVPTDVLLRPGGQQEAHLPEAGRCRSCRRHRRQRRVRQVHPADRQGEDRDGRELQG